MRMNERRSALGGATFLVLFVIHRILQGLGPASPADATAYYVEHKTALTVSELAVGLALLAFLAFLAPLIATIWRSGAQVHALVTLIAGTVFIAMGYASMAAESALIAVAGAPEGGADQALYQLQARIPVIFTIAALALTISWSGLRTGLLPRGLNVAGLISGGLFLLGSALSVVGDTPEGRSSVAGIAVYVAWMGAVCGALWQRARPRADDFE